jgi:hypothetical protein
MASSQIQKPPRHESGWLGLFHNSLRSGRYNGLDGIAILGFDMLKKAIGSTNLVDLFASVPLKKSVNVHRKATMVDRRLCLPLTATAK